MDIAAMSMQQNLQMLQGAVSTSVLNKAMNRDAQSMAVLLGDFAAANPLPAAPLRPGALDIRV